MHIPPPDPKTPLLSSPPSPASPYAYIPPPDPKTPLCTLLTSLARKSHDRTPPFLVPYTRGDPSSVLKWWTLTTAPSLGDTQRTIDDPHTRSPLPPRPTRATPPPPPPPPPPAVAEIAARVGSTGPPPPPAPLYFLLLTLLLAWEGTSPGWCCCREEAVLLGGAPPPAVPPPAAALGVLLPEAMVLDMVKEPYGALEAEAASSTLQTCACQGWLSGLRRVGLPIDVGHGSAGRRSSWSMVLHNCVPSVAHSLIAPQKKKKRAARRATDARFFNVCEVSKHLLHDEPSWSRSHFAKVSYCQAVSSGKNAAKRSFLLPT